MITLTQKHSLEYIVITKSAINHYWTHEISQENSAQHEINGCIYLLRCIIRIHVKISSIVIMISEGEECWVNPQVSGVPSRQLWPHHEPFQTFSTPLSFFTDSSNPTMSGGIIITLAPRSQCWETGNVRCIWGSESTTLTPPWSFSESSFSNISNPTFTFPIIHFYDG